MAKHTKKHRRVHKPDLTKMYRRHEPPLDVDNQDFRAVLLRPSQHHLNIDNILSSVSWVWEVGNPVLTGTATFDRDDFGHVTLKDGWTFKLDVRWGGKWREVWRMRMRNGKPTLAGQTSFDLADDGALLQESMDHWHFAKSKHKPKGWLCHEVAAEVFRRYRVPVGKLAMGKHYITGLSGNHSPMQILQMAYALERRKSGRRFVIRWQNGKINIVPLRRNPLLYVLGPLIEDATLGREDRDEKFATSVTVRAAIKGHGSRKVQKIVVNYTNEKAVAQEGFIHKNMGGGEVKTRDQALDKAKRYIAQHSIRKRTITSLTHPGMAFIRRGDACEVHLPSYGFSGKRGIAFVTGGTWTIAGGSFDMNIDLGFDDPYVLSTADRKARDKETRAAKRKKKQHAAAS